MNLEEIQEVFSSCPNHKNKSGPIRISEKLDRNKPEDRWAHCIERATVKHLSKAGIVTMREFTKDLDGSEIDISIQYRNHIFSDKFDKAGLTEFFK